MVHRGTTRESKRINKREISNPEAKMRRHRNKNRIWRRCIARLELNAACLGITR